MNQSIKLSMSLDPLSYKSAHPANSSWILVTTRCSLPLLSAHTTVWPFCLLQPTEWDRRPVRKKRYWPGSFFFGANIPGPLKLRAKAPKNRPGPKGKQSSNHPFWGAMLVLERVAARLQYLYRAQYISSCLINIKVVKNTRQWFYLLCNGGQYFKYPSLMYTYIEIVI